MRINEIKKWLQKRKYEEYGIKTDINPAITFFGIITFSMARIKVDPNPDKWSEKEKQIIADILETELKISLDRFNKCLKEEISKIKKEQLGLILNQIADKLTEKSLISLEEFEKRTEIKKLLEYKKYIGKEEELKELSFFLQDDEKTMFVTGEGGSGKTRLAIEFARWAKNKNWQVYFVNPNKSFKYLGINSNGRRILLILDDASRYIERDKIIDFVLNPPLDIDLKLLLLDRPIFKDRIKNKLREVAELGEPYQIKKSDIIPFLREYFEIKIEEAIEIEEKCKNSFVWAAFFAEDYKSSGKIRELKDILVSRTEKYIKDVVVRTRLELEDVRKIIFLISLVTPIFWLKDKKYFKEILFQHDYENFEKIIGVAEEQIDILTISNAECSIKPDPVADFIRSEFIKEERFYSILKKFLPCMPLRISYNIDVILDYTEEIEEIVNLLNEIWKELNVINGRSPEYFSALIFFTDMILEFPYFDINKARINKWILCYKEIDKIYPEKKVRWMLVAALGNAVNACIKANNLKKMGDCIKELRQLHEEFPEKEVWSELAAALVNAVNADTKANDLKKIEDHLEELGYLYKKHPEKEIRWMLAATLVNIGNAYVKANDLKKIEDIKIIEDIYGKFSKNIFGNIKGEKILRELVDSIKGTVKKQITLKLSTYKNNFTGKPEITVEKL